MVKSSSLNGWDAEERMEEMSTRERLINTSKDRISALEKRLSGLLRPIQPRREFVHSVRQRIQIVRRPSIVNRFTFIQFILIVLAGVISAAMLMVMGTRALLSLLTALGILHQASPRQGKPVQISN
jgi:hypothetical protein